MQMQKPEGSYHHGDLRAALLVAAGLELQEKGIEGFSLRGVAKRAGVSHAAPAHHFGDANGLLTALAAQAYEKFLETQKNAMEEIGGDAESALAASGLGYVRFALANPALFRLIFSSDRPDYADPALQAAAEAAFNFLVDCVENARGDEARNSLDVVVEITAAWAMAHGIADLLISGRPKLLAALPHDEQEQAILKILARSVGG